ncbi:fumarylacetoacetate hydrolase family protein [Actinomycetospora termitidis]|uniref:Fumarylacetoacetate hydrolase family protein n=1 Tax=Actinomycetospora termitidis TaxID=3053470 RepID=A0ABT7MIE3_9PSEU|nr:fumarylacetoacetate hydrolase family protein [Actinomycetospora sp. Odt1-22]MDL5159662.1 fumarylacetoacetate hydrolase family protein [Actinomycetospora sp. Odt1-22]
MRWITFADAAGDRVGLVGDDGVHPLEPDITLLDLLDDGTDALATAASRARTSAPLPLDDLVLRAPLQPRALRDCIGFLQHLRNCQGGVDMPLSPRHAEVPGFYFSNAGAVTGPRDDIPVPPGSQQFDFELEVAAVIGTPGVSIPREKAEDHIAGYLVYCDWSARDLQIEERALQLGPAKGKDGANSLGPMLVTPDEISHRRSGEGFDLRMTAHVNGDLVSEGRWSTVDWGFADIVAYASRGARLRPGDVIGSGTVPTGCLFEHFAMDPDHFRGWLRPGDEVVLAVEELGELRHRVVAGQALNPLRTGY